MSARASPVLAAVLALAGCAGDAPPPAGESSGPPVEARASLDPAVATIGDRFTYTLTVERRPDHQVTMPPSPPDLAGLTLVDQGRREPRRMGERLVETWWYELRADRVGSHVLPGTEIRYRPAGDGATGPERSLTTAELFLEVRSVLPAEGEVADIRDIKPLHSVGSPWPWWLTALLAAVGLLLLGVVLQRRRRGSGREAPPPPPPHVTALRALDSLELPDPGDRIAVRRFHFRLSRLVRDYVEGRFGLNATDLTTEEIAAALEELPEMEAGHRESLEALLRRTDLVKFAAREPRTTESRRAREAARSFVLETRPPEPEEGGE